MDIIKPNSIFQVLMKTEEKSYPFTCLDISETLDKKSLINRIMNEIKFKCQSHVKIGKETDTFEFRLFG